MSTRRLPIPAAASGAGDAVVVCLACRRDVAHGPAAHAEQVAGLHDEQHHDGRPVAFPVPAHDPFGGDAA
jgi:hypothetical protein